MSRSFAPWSSAASSSNGPSVHGHLYGTSRKAIESRLAAGEDVVLEIDWQGALQIKRLFAHAVLIFILPPSWDELRQRLLRRGEDAPAVIETRMANARVEVARAKALRLRYNQRSVRDGAVRPQDGRPFAAPEVRRAAAQQVPMRSRRSICCSRSLASKGKRSMARITVEDCLAQDAQPLPAGAWPPPTGRAC